MHTLSRWPIRSRAVLPVLAGISLSSPVSAQTPVGATEQVVISATRTERSVTDVPQSVTVLSGVQVNATPAFALDDALRAVPSINLPNAASYQLHPTSNTISMRGLGGTRALVLLDGVPLNDGLFGVVQWNRVPMQTVDRIEVVRGGGATLWGNYAMGGVINIITQTPEREEFVVDAGYGSYGTYRANGYAAIVPSEKFKLSGAISYSSTDGYDTTPAAFSTPLDVPVSFEALNVATTANVLFAPDLSGLFRVNYHTNHQRLGTPLQENRQHIIDLSGSVKRDLGAGTALTANAFYSDSGFQTNNTGAPSGAAVGFAEFIQNLHVTPVKDGGASLLLSGGLGDLLPLISGGADVRIISGSDIAHIFDETGSEIRKDIGRGKQRFIGIFGQASVMPFEGLEILASAREEWIANYDGFDGNPGGIGNVPETSVSSFDPRVSLRYSVTPNFALRAAAYKAFRAPNLDNLYRAFSVPFGIFYPNPQLTPEKLKGAEVGFDVDFDPIRFAVTGYWNDITNLLTYRNLDESELPPGFFFGSRNINAGAARARGVEAEIDWRVTEELRARFGYGFADSIITDNPQEPISVGNQLAGVPQHQATFGVFYEALQGWRLSSRIRLISKSYADNAHTLKEDEQFVVDVSAAYPIFKNGELFVDIENLFDNHYIANNSGFNPPRLGTPLTVFGGVRVRFN